jgi:hypothetical protein
MASEASTGKTERRIRAQPEIEVFLAGDPGFPQLRSLLGIDRTRRKKPNSVANDLNGHQSESSALLPLPARLSAVKFIKPLV